MGISFVDLEQDALACGCRMAKAAADKRNGQILFVHAGHWQRAGPPEIHLGRCLASPQAGDRHRALIGEGEIHGRGQDLAPVQEQLCRFLIRCSPAGLLVFSMLQRHAEVVSS
jgi:hypothetical protein